MSDVPEFPLHEAAKQNQPLIIRGLLAENPKLVLKRDLDGRTALHWAVSGSHEEVVSLLLNPGASSVVGLTTASAVEIDLDDLTDDSGWTPLHIAASVGNLSILQQLLAHEPSPDVNQATNNGTTALHFAVAKDHVEVVAELLKAGASARVKDCRGQYPLHRAASIGNIAIVTLLLDKGRANVKTTDGDDWTPLHHAFAEGHEEVARYLVEKGADPEAQTLEGQKPGDVASLELKRRLERR